MIEVIPAIMPKSFSDLVEKVALVSPYVTSVQCDLMDGKFVSGKTWPYFSYSDPDFAALLEEKKALPQWDTIDYEIDLMSATPESDAFDWIKVGASRIILHLESSSEIKKLVEEIRAEHGNPTDVPGVPEIGIASLNSTPISETEALVPFIDFVQVMGIARIGFQGEPFDPSSLERIRALKTKFPNLPISVDGGVNGESAPLLVRAGADRLVSGSYIFKSTNIAETITSMKGLRH